MPRWKWWQKSLQIGHNAVLKNSEGGRLRAVVLLVSSIFQGCNDLEVKLRMKQAA